MKKHDPKIITFYSYKGGVGRSMALANTAYLLAKEHNYKVIIVDWDLEAPGLHRYFGIPRKNIKKGLIDLFYDFKELLRKKNNHFDDKSINIDEYIQPIFSDVSRGSISILPAGKFDEKLSDRVNKFDWDDFYKIWHGFGFIEFLKTELKKRADFVLIDSRTGLSDIGGICTLQLPDIVALLFSFNEQNLYGTKFICDCISKKSIQIAEKNEPPKMILVPSRIESYLEMELLQKWEQNASEILKEYLPKNETALYLKEMAIPYIAYYSFGEKLAVNLNLHDKVSESIEKLTKIMLEFSSLMDVSSQLEARILDAITIQEPSLRNKILLEMVSELKDETTSSDLAKSILKIALDEVKTSANEELKAKTLKEIAFHIHLVDISEFLKLVKEIQNEDLKASILISVISELLDSKAIDLLNVIKNFKDEHLKVDLLIELINGEVNYTKKDSVIVEILDLAKEIRDENSKIRLFIELFPSQPLSVRVVLIEHVLKILNTVKNPNYIFIYLRQMISYLKSSVEKDLIVDLLKTLLQSEEIEIRKRAVCIIGEINSEKVILVLIEALKDIDYSVRISAMKAFETAFQSAPNKQQVWNDLHRLTSDQNDDVRSAAAFVLGAVFSQVPDKQQAWSDLVKLTKDKNSDVRSAVASVLGTVFSQVSDKQQVWNDLHRLTSDQNDNVRSAAASVLGTVFSQVPDKQQVWNDLHRLTSDQNDNVRSAAASVLGAVFSQVPDKQQVWSDLHRLISDQNDNVRFAAASVLGTVFSQVPYRKQALNNLVKLTKDKNSDVRSVAASVLGSVFSQVPDKQQVWSNLHRLTKDQNSDVKSSAASVLGAVFSQVPDKQRAWSDLVKLTKDQNSNVKSSATSALESAFFQVPDKQWAWSDLHRLTNDQNSDVRSTVASALGSVFSQVPDKQQAWDDLHKLTNDAERNVRIYANHSLGKISIFKASQTEEEDDYKRELERAIVFFEEASKESEWNNPSQFCLPFYRSFYTITFKEYGEKGKVDKYLAEAKAAIGDSKEKELLFGALENISEALKESQSLGYLDLSEMKGELNFYRKYCDRAAELMGITEEIAPFATATIRKGLPILDRNMKEILEELQRKAKIASGKSKGTDTEEIAFAVSREVQKWEIGSQEEMTQKIEDIAYILKTQVANLPENEYVLNKIESMRKEKDLAKQYETLLFVIGQIATVKVVPENIITKRISKTDQD